MPHPTGGDGRSINAPDQERKDGVRRDFRSKADAGVLQTASSPMGKCARGAKLADLRSGKSARCQGPRARANDKPLRPSSQCDIEVPCIHIRRVQNYRDIRFQALEKQRAAYSPASRRSPKVAVPLPRKNYGVVERALAGRRGLHRCLADM